MASYNHVFLIGHMTANPELKQTPAGLSVTSFSIGVTRRYKGADGNYVSDFFSIVAWRETAEFICKNFQKGQPILVDGQLQTRNYTGQDGQKRYITEVLANAVSFVEKKSDRAPMPGDESAPPAHAQAPANAQTPAQPTLTPPADGNYTVLDPGDDLPF